MNASSRLTTLTRIGFATRGILYIVIALLVIRSGRAEDTSGALQYVGGGGGRILLIVMAAGLCAYGIWRLCDAAFNIERHAGDRKGIMERLAAGMSGVVHMFLTWQAIRLIRGIASSGDSAQDGTQAALELPGGWVLVILGSVVLFAVGAVQVVKAIKASFLRHLEPRIARHPWVQWSGRAGYAARGLVFMISAYLLMRAGYEAQASEAGGMAEALAWLTSPADVVIALGLLGFGLFSLIEARFRVLQDVPVEGIGRRVTGL